ncbi:MAG: beta-galactosidase trimerization domain-containing protein [Chitinophagaceae bacterium]|nr:beta-galactosidase trimerization domain-containing protein [Chitinophagaceae bacterium]
MRISFVFLLAFYFAALFASAQQKNNQPEERFAGLHLDFHAAPGDSAIGKTFTYEMIDSMLSIIKPDFIQVDCKGHPGISSYPTKVGNPAPAFDKDILKIWRDVTNKYKIPLFVHYSGVWDNAAINHHPNWARYNADGKQDKNATSLFGGYADSLLIPQIKELATNYKLDGIWVDGDCWVLAPDYSPAAKEKFIQQTGITVIPTKPDEPHYFEWMEFHRKAFRDYISKYANAAHEAAPAFRVTSNWSFSSMMPEPVDVPVDYLSGDVAGANSLYSSAFESRCLALQGKPWDLMSWSFAWKNNSKATKPVVQLQQEAAEVLAMGGGFQTYWQQNRDGTPEPYHFRKMAEIIKFTKERKEYTFQSETVPQIGLLFSTYAWKRIPNSGLYNSHGQEAIKGILNLLLDCHYPVDILMDHQLPGSIQKYPLLIIPEWEHIDPATRQQLQQYVQNGGKLLITGASATVDFAAMLGVQFEQPVKKDGLFAGLDGEIILMGTNYMQAKQIKALKTFGTQITADDWRFSTHNFLASITESGKGKAAGIYIDMGDFYNRNQNGLLKNLMQKVIAELVPSFISTLPGPEPVHQVIRRKNNKLYIHLINAGGEHNNPNVLAYEKLTPLENIAVKLQIKQPKEIRLQPGNKKIPFTYNNHSALLKVPKIEAYSILEVAD